MKLFAFIVSENETRIKRAPDSWAGEGWYEIEREPDRADGERLEFDPDLETIVIKKREKTPEQLVNEEKAKSECNSFTPSSFADLVKRVEALEKKP